MLTPGTRLGRWRIVELLGRGASSEIHAAVDDATRECAVLKVPIANIVGDGAAMRRWRRETAIVGRLDHRNVQRTADRGETRDRPYLALERVHGDSLRAVLRRRGTLPVADAVDVACQAASALEHVHAHGVVHRDVKPENLLVEPGGRVVLIDFGLATHGRGRLHLRATDDRAGTPDYMAPERLTGLAGDARTDVYALGVVLHEMLAGAPPFTAATPDATAARILRETAPSLDRVAGVDPRLAHVVARALRKDPDERWPTAAALRAALAAWPSAPPPPPLAAERAVEDEPGERGLVLLHLLVGAATLAVAGIVIGVVALVTR